MKMNQTEPVHAENAAPALDATQTETKKPNKRWRILSSVFLFALIAGAMYFALRDTSIAEVWSALKSADPLWLLCALGASLIAALMFGIALHISLRALNGKPVSLIRSIGFGFIGQYYTAITPAGAAGQPMQLYYMLGYGVEVSYASLSLLLVNASHQIVVLLIPALLFPFRSALILDNLGAFLWFLLFGVIVNIGLILFLVFAMFSQNFVNRAVGWTIRFLTKMKILKKPDAIQARVNKQIALYKQGAEVFRQHPWLLAGELFAYIVLLGMQFVIPYFIYRAFGLSGYGMIDFIALQSVLYLAVCFLPLPGSAGASESGFVTIFRVLFQSALIVPAMLLSRMVSFYVILLISGIVSLIMHFILTRSRKRALESASAEIAVPPEA
ncbi:MAG: lysylphosphatidylglycerol synthase transmembrane domain-containing protein [Clostridiaceae bacterium]